MERHWAVTKVHPLLPLGLNTINPGIIVGGPGGGKNGRLNIFTNAGTVPNYCSLEYQINYLPQEKYKDIKTEFEGYIAIISEADPWLRENPPKITWKLNGASFPPAETPSDHPFVKLAYESQSQLGHESKIKGFDAVSDLAWLVEAGIPGIPSTDGGLFIWIHALIHGRFPLLFGVVILALAGVDLSPQRACRTEIQCR